VKTDTASARAHVENLRRTIDLLEQKIHASTRTADSVPLRTEQSFQRGRLKQFLEEIGRRRAEVQGRLEYAQRQLAQERESTLARRRLQEQVEMLRRELEALRI